MKPTNEEIKSRNENIINNDNNSLIDENIFKIPEIYKLDYRGKNQDEINKMIKEFNEKKSSENNDDNDEIITSFSDYDLDQIEKKEIARRMKERYKKESNGKLEDEEFDDSDVFDLEKVEFIEVKKWNEAKYRESDKKVVRTWKKHKDDKLYSFEVEELIKLEKYLKSKIIGQNHIIEEYINTFLLNTYRDDNNSKNLWIYFNFGPSWAWKNYIWELIAKKLDFWLYNYSLSSTYYVEATSLLWSTDWFTSWNTSIFEHIENISSKKKATIIIFDEIEKWVSSENWNLSTFFTAIMNIIDNRYVNTKNSNTEIDQANFIFVFNSNIGYDEYESNENTNKIWFDIWNNNKATKVEIDADYIEKYFKNKQKINISVFNRLKRWNNFFFFNRLKSNLFKEYFEKEFNNLKIELCYNFDYSWEQLPDIWLFKDKIKNFDYTKWYRWINDIIHIDTKLFIMKNYIFKNQYKKWKLVWLRK